MPYMYILECADGSYYTGSTWELERRLWEHQNGLGARHTAKRLPVKLVHCEYFDRIEDAFRREKQVQGWSRRKKQALIQENYDKLRKYSRNYSQYPSDPAPLPEPVEGNPLPEPVEGNPPQTTTAAASTRSAAAGSAAAGSAAFKRKLTS